MSGAEKFHGKLRKFIDKKLIGHTDSNDLSKKWCENFSRHPTWCDAGMALEQINNGNAHGNRISLYGRSLFQKILFQIGKFIQNFPNLVLIFGILFLLICCVGLKNVTIETDVVKLWVPQGGRLADEIHFYNRLKNEYAQNSSRPSQKSEMPELPRGEGLGDAFQVVIQTSEVAGKNLLNKEDLLRHVELMTDISLYTINLYGRDWALSDICFKPPPMNTPKSRLLAPVKSILTKIIPCVWITPIDCFWEGAKPLGPHPPVELPEEATTILSLPKYISWTSLNPSKLLEEVGQLLDTSMIEIFFQKAGVGAAYTDKPCINPLDADCPQSSPNFFNVCHAYTKFDAWNAKLSENEKIFLTPASTTTTTTEAPSNTSDYYSYDDDKEEVHETTHVTSEEIKCQKFGQSFLEWIKNNPNKLDEFLEKDELPHFPNYGEILTKGCTGFGKKIMKWPESLIIGGVHRDKRNQIDKVEAFQSVFLVAAPGDLYKRIKENEEENLPLDWSPDIAQEVIRTWQRNFTKNVYNHRFNDVKNNVRIIHPLAATSIKDILVEFSQFDFTIIFIGYALMILYAAWTQFHWHGFWFSVKSSSGLAIVGVLLITLSFIAGLGISILLGFNFNASTTQIIPFLALGLGISDMFMLLYNYNLVMEYAQENEIAILLKETGMAVIITSMNIILAFVVGIFLPTPALKAFCAQVAILLFFNLICNMLLFTASMAIDLKRRKAQIRDLTVACCCTCMIKKNKIGEIQIQNRINSYKSSQNGNANHLYSTNHARKSCMEEIMYKFLTKIYIPLLCKVWFKAIILLISIIMLIFGVFGLYNMTIGLELSDVLPKETPPAQFLQAQEKYFGFYPMYIVLNGGEIDIPHKQQLIENLRSDIANSTYIVKDNGQSSKKSWMHLMKDWLLLLQEELNKALASGLISTTNGSVLVPTNTLKRPLPPINQVALLGRRLVCSVGNEYKCDGRIGHVKLVDKDIINPDGFYNYLTAWFNMDNMMYYVSQALFFPTPPEWPFDPQEDALVPPAPPLLYIQIPFYLNNLVNTTVIVDMINEIRGISENYTRLEVTNFPTGIPFTFWEQYLHLTRDLTVAVVIIAGAVLLVIALILFNLWAALMVALVVVCVTIQLAGFMGLFGVKLNPVSAVTLVASVGISVEFTAYIIISFLTALGTRNERMCACLEHMFIPVVHGGISALLGLTMLAFTPFEFIFKYFFVTMTVLILIGMFNGVAVLLVLLSIFGPPSEVVPNDGSIRLPIPPVKKVNSSVQESRF